MATLAANPTAISAAKPLIPAAWKPHHNPWAIALTVTLATFMEVLDTSIANVALPHMAGSLGASQEEATWVLTSYLVSSAIVLPISGWLSNRFGRKRFYMTCVALFTICSFLCGISTSLPELIIFRILQGFFGGGLQPSSKGKRIRFSGEKRIVIDGPFAETKELIAGYSLWQVRSMEEAIEWAMRCPNPHQGEMEIEIRPVYEAETWDVPLQ